MKKIILSLFVAGLIAGCATVPPYNPFSVEKNEIYSSVKTIGLLPFFSQIDADNLDDKLNIMESTVKGKLEGAGFHVIESSKYKVIYDEYKAAMGPLYDANTGERNEEKYKALREQTMREYLAQNKVDALFYGGTVIVKARWIQNSASWNGATEATSGKTGFWANLALGQSSGDIPAISFSSYLERPDNTRLYSLNGGIQLAQWYQGGQFVDVPQNLIFSDRSKIEFGVSTSLTPLLEQNSSKFAHQTGRE